MTYAVNEVYFLDTRDPDCPPEYRYGLDGVLARAIGRTGDGRSFYTETLIARAMWDGKGRDWCEQFVRSVSRPPGG